MGYFFSKTGFAKIPENRTANGDVISSFGGYINADGQACLFNFGKSYEPETQNYFSNLQSSFKKKQTGEIAFMQGFQGFLGQIRTASSGIRPNASLSLSELCANALLKPAIPKSKKTETSIKAEKSEETDKAEKSEETDKAEKSEETDKAEDDDKKADEAK